MAATIVDGLVYQGLLFAWPGRYGVAAAAAAIAGALTNFSLNRSWTFAGIQGNVVGQAVRYVLVSLLTFLCLRGVLWLLIERLHVDMRLAWLPGKLLAFLLVSYPMQRWWVFKARPSGLAVAERDAAHVQRR